MKQPLLGIAIAVSILALLSLLVGLATVGWLTDTSYYVGLFQACNDVLCAKREPTDTEVSVRLLVVVAFLLCCAGLVISGVHLVKFVLKDVVNRTLPFVAAIEFFVAGSCSILGCIIYAAKVKDEIELLRIFPMKIGYSFVLTLVGGLICFASGTLIMIQRSRS